MTYNPINANVTGSLNVLRFFGLVLCYVPPLNINFFIFFKTQIKFTFSLIFSKIIANKVKLCTLVFSLQCTLSQSSLNRYLGM